MKLDDLKNIDFQELQETLGNLDFENVGSWPAPVKLGAAIIVFVAVIFIGYMMSITSSKSTLAGLERKEQTLMQDFESKAFKAQNLGEYKKQLDEMEESFGALLKQLPKDTEVPGLLEDITHTGLGSGLEFDKIELGTEREREFYAELPINISVTGDYHGFGSFVSGVASLPRIVTLHDFTVKPASKDRNLLGMTITAKTYRYASGKASDNQPGKRR